jgi:hypothetical protein
MFSKGFWSFNVKDSHCNLNYWNPYIPPEPKIKRNKFIKFQNFKIYHIDWGTWTAKEEFFRRYEQRRPLTKKEVYERFILKYKTVLNWLCVSYNGKEQFWKNIGRDYAEDKLDCYELRLEEIMSTCTDISRNYWRTQKNISTRCKRTQLLQSEIFQKRRSYCRYKGRIIR